MFEKQPQKGQQMAKYEEKKDRKKDADVFRGLSVRAEYKLPEELDADEEQRDEEVKELTERVRQLRGDSNHIAQGLYW